MLHSSERLLQVWTSDEMYTSLFDIVGPSAIGEIKEDAGKLKTPEQRIGEPDKVFVQVQLKRM